MSDPNRDPQTRTGMRDESTNVVVEPSRRGGSAGLIAAAVAAIVVIVALLAWAIPDRGPIEEGLESDPAAATAPAGDVDIDVDASAGSADGATIEEPVTEDGDALEDAPPADDTDAGVPADEPVTE
ncbi:hypothetical protein [Pseudoroseicyclus sp. CXY001]|uniref:hypothetical protein n=1 Tax=Pseudoroseicyclus sp. CXY001 TaxID=3242492 RepID=UPI0035715571